MNDARWERIKRLFNETMERPAAERAEFMDIQCAGDPELREEVQSLVDAVGSTRDRSPIQTGGAAELVSEAATTGLQRVILRERPGSSIGPYKLLQQIGEGGFGLVFLAEQSVPVRRRVALKIIKLGMDTKAVIARFEAERQALALMDHPHIARVIDGGATESGRPYFVMEYVVGEPIIAFADARKLTVSDRLALFGQVCSAVQHAHTKGVIHRDIKPANVLVSMIDGKPFAKVIDFGIAKATASPLTDKTLFTEHKQLIGTLEYMSPEQAEGSHDIDTRTDVYALGVLLYELLTGLTPFDGKRLRSAAWVEMQRIIREEDPPLPSVRVTSDSGRLSQTAAARAAEPSRLGTMIRGELDWIVMRALDKDRARRYDSPASLATDVERHLRGEAVEAAPPSKVYRLRKFARRNKGPVIAGSAVAVALVAGTSIAWAGWKEATSQRTEAEHANVMLQDNVNSARRSLLEIVSLSVPLDSAEHETLMREHGLSAEEARLQQAQAYVAGMKYILDERQASSGSPTLNSDLTALAGVSLRNARDLVEAKNSLSAKASELESANNTLVAEQRVRSRWTYRGQLAAARIALQERDFATCNAQLAACPVALRNWEWGHLATKLEDASLVLKGHPSPVRSAEFSRDGRLLLTIGSDLRDDGVARVWDVVSGKELCSVRSERTHFSMGAFGPDGSTFVTATMPRAYMRDENFEPYLQVWDSHSGVQRSRFTLPRPTDSTGHSRGRLRLSSDHAKLIWSRFADRRTAIIDMSKPAAPLWLEGHGTFRGDVPFSSDGKLACTIVGNEDDGESVTVWDTANGQVQFRTPAQIISAALQGRQVFYTAFTPDSSRLITNHWSGNTTVWNLKTKSDYVSLLSLSDTVRGSDTHGGLNPFFFPMDVSADGKLAATLSEDEEGVRLWNLATGQQLWKVDDYSQVDFVKFSPDGSMLAVNCNIGTTAFINTSSGKEVLSLVGQAVGGAGLCGTPSPFSPDGKHIVTKGPNGDVLLWPLQATNGHGCTTFANRGLPFEWSIFAPSSSTVIGATDKSTLQVCDARTGDVLTTIRSESSTSIFKGVLSRDERLLATFDQDSFVRVWDLKRGNVLASRVFAADTKDNEHFADISSIRFLGKKVLIARSFFSGDSSESPLTRSEILEWDPVSWTSSDRFAQYADCGNGIVISPSETRVIFGERTGRRVLADSQSGSTLATLPPWDPSGWAPPATFSEDGELFCGLIAANDQAQEIGIWKADDGVLISHVPLDAKTGRVQSMRFSKDRGFLAFVTWTGQVGGGGELSVIDVADAKIRWSAVNFGKSMDTLDISPDGSRIVTSTGSKVPVSDVWDVTDGAKVFSLPYRLGGPFHVDDRNFTSFNGDGTCFMLFDSDRQPVVARSQPRRHQTSPPQPQ